MPLTKHEIAKEVTERTGIGTNLARNVMDTLVIIAEEEISKGEKFVLPNLVSIDFKVKKGYKKGEKYRNPFTGEEGKRDSSKPESLGLKAKVQGGRLQKSVPSAKTKAGKAVMQRVKR